MSVFKSEAIQFISFLLQNNFGVSPNIVVVLTGCPTMVVKVASKPPVNHRGQGSKSFVIWKMKLVPKVYGQRHSVSMFCVLSSHISTFQIWDVYQDIIKAVPCRWSAGGIFPWRTTFLFNLGLRRETHCANDWHPTCTRKRLQGSQDINNKKETSIGWALPKHCISG